MNLTVELEDITDSITITRQEDGSVVIRRGGSQTGVASPSDAGLEEILDRWRRRNATSGAFRLVEEAQGLGFDVVPPEPRAPEKKADAYVRVIDATTSGAAIAYVNTSSMSVHATPLRGVAANLPGADVHPNGAVYFDINDVGACLDALENLRAMPQP